MDVFSRTDERRMERQLLSDYRDTIDELLSQLNHDNHALAVQIAEIPEHIRGYGHVKEAHVEKSKAKAQELLAIWRTPSAEATKAA